MNASKENDSSDKISPQNAGENVSNIAYINKSAKPSSIKSNNFIDEIKDAAKYYSEVVNQAHNSNTMTMTREELQAHLDKQSAQTQAALAAQNGVIEGRLGRFEERIDQAIGQMHKDRDDLKSDIKSAKWTIVGTLIASVLAIVFGVAAFNSTVLSNMVASFESGKNTMQSINDTTKRLEDLQARIEAQAERASAASSQPRK